MSKKPSDKGRLNDLEKGFNYNRQEPPGRTCILDNGIEPQHYIAGLSNNTNTLTSCTLLIILTSEAHSYISSNLICFYFHLTITIASLNIKEVL